MTASSAVGLIANPASGKDIRRLVAHGSTFDNNEKINIVRRVLLGLDASGVDTVHYLPDSYGIVPRAAQHLTLQLALHGIPMEIDDAWTDSFQAARRLEDLGVRAIVTLGGDGTNRVVAKGCGRVPIVPISTGTNNVFPRMVEGTLAGLAAGVFATGAADADACLRQAPKLDVAVDGAYRDFALIDVAVSGMGWVGARALWDPAQLRAVALSRIDSGQIGLCAIGGALFPDLAGTVRGAFATIGTDSAPMTVRIPIAPGIVRMLPIERATTIESGETVALGEGPCTVAFDGERELEIMQEGACVTVTFNPDGPSVLDIDAALAEAARRGVFKSTVAPD